MARKYVSRNITKRRLCRQFVRKAARRVARKAVRKIAKYGDRKFV